MATPPLPAATLTHPYIRIREFQGFAIVGLRPRVDVFRLIFPLITNLLL